MLPKCKNLNNDLIIWHGMSTQNISVSVRQGLSFALRRRKIWLGIIEVEVNKKNKSIVGQSVKFSTRRLPTGLEVGSTRIKSQGLDTATPEDDASCILQSPENRARYIIEGAVASLSIQVNESNTTIIKGLVSIIAAEIRANAEASKVLSFILYRDQAPSNHRPCIPTGPESYAIYTDIMESCIQIRDPNMYKHMHSIGVDRCVVWTLFQAFISETLPLVLRIRFLDLVLVKGCIVLVPAMLVYLVWRREALLQTNTSADFVACIEQAHVDWLPNDKLEAFWSKCVGMHTQAFLDMYMEQTLRMRLKAVTIARQRDCRQSLPEQLQRDIFHYANYSWIGFDVDHTLVEYRLPYLLQTSFSQAAKDLQKDFVVLRTIPLATWLPSIAQRGIAVDTARGNFLHIGEDGSIKRAYHGSHKISYFSFNVLYGDTETSDGGGNSVCSFANSSKMMYLYTAADIIYAPLYAWMVDAFDTGVITREELETSLYLVPDIEQQPPGNPDDPFLANKTVYVSLSTFVLKAARSFYAGTFWKMIISTPDLLIQPNADIVSFLDMLKTSFGRQLFVLTNGSWTHCNTVMQFAVGRNWMKYFDLVVTEANKEVFFDEFNVLPFSELDAQSVANNDTSARRVQKKLVTKLSRHKIYAHGNVKTLMTFFSENAWHPTSTNLIVEKGQRICYFGDHLMQDVYLPARHTTTWDLVAIVKEIQNLGQPAEVEELWTCPSWFSQWMCHGPQTVTPDLRSSFFFLGPSGSTTYFGKKVREAATLCLPSVGKLAHCNGVLKVGMVQPGGRYSSSIELIALPKRVIAKIRSMENSL